MSKRKPTPKPSKPRDFSRMKLGLNPSPPDDRDLHLEHYFKLAKLPAAPATCNWATAVKQPWGMLLNDQIGCCAVAAPAHMELAYTCNDDDSAGPYCPTDDDVLRAYRAVSGYTPGKPETDVGCDLLSVMNYWRKTGIGNSRIGAHTMVGTRGSNWREVWAQATWIFGGVHIGIAMPAAWQSLAPGETWTGPPGRIRRKADQPGGWGGHAVNVVSYGKSGLRVVTWGVLQRLTWRAVELYCMDARVPVARSWLGANQRTVHGFDAAALMSDLAAIR